MAVTEGTPAYDNSDASSTGTALAESNSETHTTAILDALGLGTGDGWEDYDQTFFKYFFHIIKTAKIVVLFFSFGTDLAAMATTC